MFERVMLEARLCVVLSRMCELKTDDTKSSEGFRSSGKHCQEPFWI